MNPDEASADPAPVERLLGDLSRLQLGPHKPSLRYRARLLVVAMLMVLLPLVYFAAVGFLAWLVAVRLLDPPRASDLWGWAGYVALATLGPVCIFFLIKPWFMRRSAEGEAVPLRPGEAPDLECFVGLLAHAVGAPGPRSIELDCSVNASASFSGGWRGMWKHELKLTLGMPLIAGLDMRSFVGVLAHELGHFSQRAGMRLAWFVMLVNEWFARLVHGRDRWDTHLQAAARSDRPVVQGFGLVALGLVWLARQPLQLLMWIAKAASGFALREMEFDADGYEIVFAGSDAFRRTSREINLLNVGSAKALRLIGEAMPEGHLPRNLPALARKQTETLSDRVRAAVEEEMMTASARFALFKGAQAGDRGATFFSTHPSDRERIEIAESYGEPGLVHSQLPASSLFGSFEEAAERITGHFYGTYFATQLKTCELVGNAQFAGTVRSREERFEACERFFEGRFTVARPLLFPRMEVREVLAGRYLVDRQAGTDMRRWLREGVEVFEAFEAAEEEILNVARASELFQAGFRIRRKAFGLPRGLAALSDQQSAASARRDMALVKLGEFDQLARRCLLTIASDSLGRDRDPRQIQTERVLRALGEISGEFPMLLKLRRRVLAQRALLQNVSAATLGRTVIERLQRNSTELAELSDNLRKALSKIPYPFDHAAGRISVTTYATAELCDARMIAASFQSAETLLERLFDLYFRLVGYLCQIALDLEGDS